MALSTAYDGQAFAWTAGQCRAFRKLDSKVDEYGRPGPGGAMQYTASVEFEPACEVPSDGQPYISNCLQG